MIKVDKVSAAMDLDQAFAIRKKVFVEEQNCPPELEYANDDVATHFLATCEDEPCGAARWRKTDNGYKLERFAVSREFRGRGVGKHLVRAVLNDLPGDGSQVYLNSQLDAVEFYCRLGFQIVGEEFEEAGIRHRKMVLQQLD